MRGTAGVQAAEHGQEVLANQLFVHGLLQGLAMLQLRVVLLVAIWLTLMV
jgi:hypothetical protein